jgi:tetratricopeptide (TPR) repeat protein
VTTAKVRKLGTLSMPVPVTATFEDGSSQCLYTDRLLDECTLVFTSQMPLKEIKLDAHNELPLVVPPPDPIIAQLKKAIHDLDFTGEGNKALQIFDEVKNIKLDGVEFPWFRLGMLLYDERHNQEALQAFQNESKQNPEGFIAFVWQGHIHDLMNHRDEALKCYKEALALNPRTWLRHDQWGMKIDRSWIEKRIESPFQRSDPTIISLKDRIGSLEWTGEGEKALQIFNELKNIKLDDADFPWGKLGLCLYDGKHYEEALQVFRNDFEQETKANSPYAFGSLVWQGHLYDLMDQRDKALECYERALEMKPESEVRHDQYGLKIDLDWIKERLKSPFQRD